MSLYPGNSLKGYQWLVNNEVVMDFWFKDRTLTIRKDTTKEELDKFKRFLTEEQSWNIDYINENEHKVK